MAKLLRYSLHTIYALGLLLLFLFAGNKYDWMSDLEPSVAGAGIEDGSGNRAVFLGVLLAVAITVELIVALWAKRTSERMISGLLVLLAIVAFLMA